MPVASTPETGATTVVRETGGGWVAAIAGALGAAKPGDTVTVPKGLGTLAERIRDARGFGEVNVLASDGPYRRAGAGNDIRDQPPNLKTLALAREASFAAELPALGRAIVSPVPSEPGHHAWLGPLGWHDCTAAEDAAVAAQGAAGVTTPPPTCQEVP